MAIKCIDFVLEVFCREIAPHFEACFYQINYLIN